MKCLQQTVTDVPAPSSGLSRPPQKRSATVTGSMALFTPFTNARKSLVVARHGGVFDVSAVLLIEKALASVAVVVHGVMQIELAFCFHIHFQSFSEINCTFNRKRIPGWS